MFFFIRSVFFLGHTIQQDFESLPHPFTYIYETLSLKYKKKVVEL